MRIQGKIIKYNTIPTTSHPISFETHSYVIISFKSRFFKSLQGLPPKHNTHYILSYPYYEGYPEIADRKWVEKKENHCCEGGSQPRPLSQQFPFVFAFKETSSRPQVS